MNVWIVESISSNAPLNGNLSTQDWRFRWVFSSETLAKQAVEAELARWTDEPLTWEKDNYYRDSQISRWQQRILVSIVYEAARIQQIEVIDNNLGW